MFETTISSCFVITIFLVVVVKVSEENLSDFFKILMTGLFGFIVEILLDKFVLNLFLKFGINFNWFVVLVLSSATIFTIKKLPVIKDGSLTLNKDSSLIAKPLSAIFKKSSTFFKDTNIISQINNLSSDILYGIERLVFFMILSISFSIVPCWTIFIFSFLV